MCITFTNKAAKEMKERLVANVGVENAKAITAGTFHSVAARMLRKDVHALENYGRGNDFVIYDETDTKALLRKILVEKFKEEKKKVDAGMVKGRISAAKSAVDHCVGVPGSRMVRALVDARPNLKFDPGVKNHFAAVYDEYEANLRASNALDFDDLLSATVALLKSSGPVRQHYQQRWRHVLVDEFQDTSLSQYELIRELALPRGQVFVVGDVDQAIYSWRGAEVANIRTKFDDDFFGADTVMLTKNYRSTATIVKAARAVIGESLSRSPLELDAVQPGGKDVAVVATEDEVEEAEFAAREAARAARDGVPLKEIAVLYRTHHQSRPLEEAFVRAGVPHVVIGDTAFYTRKEIKDAVAYLRVLLNPRDSVSLARIINTPPRKIGPGTLEKLTTWSDSLPWDDGMPQPLGAALLRRTWANPDQGLEEDDVLPSAKEMGLGAAAHKSVSNFCRLMRDLEVVMEGSTPGELIEAVVKSTGFKEYLIDQENGDERWGFIKELISIANEPSATDGMDSLEPEDDATAPATPATGEKGLMDFLEGVALLMSAETRSEDAQADAVKLMTMHAAKGLEFDTVFITGCEDKLIPMESFQKDGREEMDEEVRLFYVGITRAKRKLFLCRSAKRTRFGLTTYPDPSPFLAVIRDALVGGGAAKPPAIPVPTDVGEGAGKSERLAAHLAANGVRAAIGSHETFRGGRGVGGARGANGGRGAGRGGGGGARRDDLPARREAAEPADPEATKRRAARRAAASARAAAKGTAAGKGGASSAPPRAAPRGRPRRGPSE